MKITTALLLSSILAAGSAPGLAQNAPAAASESQMEEIIVTAQRREESLQRTPVSVTALTASVLEQKGVRSEADLQIAVPGLTVRAGADSTQLNYAIRGQSIDTYSFSAPAVQAYLDEVPLTNFGTTSIYDLESVQVLKGPQGTLFGQNVTGGAVLFTSAKPKNEFGGYGMMRFGNYRQKQFQGAVNLPVVTDRVLLRVSGDITRRDGYVRNLIDGDRRGDVRRNSGRIHLVLKPSDTIKNSFVFDYSRLRGEGTPAVLYSAYSPGQTNNGTPLFGLVSLLYSPGVDAAFGAPGAWASYLAAHPNAFPGGLQAFLAQQKARGPYVGSFDGIVYIRARTYAVSNVTTWDIGGGAEIKNIFGYVNSRSAQAQDLDGSPYGIEGGGPGVYGLTLPMQDYRSKQVTEELQINGKTMGDALTYTAGVYFFDQKQKFGTAAYFLDLGPIIPVTTNNVTDNGLNTKTIAGYAQGTYDLSGAGVEGLSITAGMRYTSSKVTYLVFPRDNDFNAPGLANSLSSRVKKVSWQLGVQEQVNNNLLLYVVTRRSFRGGGYNIYAVQRPGPAATGGSEFEPEIATDVEGGFKFQGRLADTPYRLNVAVYKQWVKNVQRNLYANDPVTGAIQSLTVNIPQGQIYGLEADTEIQPTRWLTVGANLAYTHAKFTKNTAIVYGAPTVYGPYPDTPKWSGSAFAQLNLPIDGVGTAVVRGDLYGQTGTYFSSLAGTQTPGTRLPGYKIVNVRAGVENIGDSGVSVTASVRNLTKKTYYVGGIPLGQVLSVNSAVPGEPRMYSIEARVKF